MQNDRKKPILIADVDESFKKEFVAYQKIMVIHRTRYKENWYL